MNPIRKLISIGLAGLVCFVALLLLMLLSFKARGQSAPGVFGNTPSLRYGLVGWWTLNVTNSNATVTDYSGRGNTGTLTNAPAIVITNGVVGGAMMFDGSTCYVDAPCLIGNTSEVTVAMWVKNLSGTALKGFFGLADSAGNQMITIYFDYEAHGFRADVKDGSSPVSPASTVVTANTWRHVVVTSSAGATGAGTMFIDGALNSTSAGALSGWVSAGRVNLGRGVILATYSAKCVMDDVRVYNRVLTADEVKLLYGGGYGCQ